MNTTERLIKYFGGRKKCAVALNVNPETVRLWKSRGIPLDRALQIEHVSKGAVTAEQILVEWRGRTPLGKSAEGSAATKSGEKTGEAA